VKLRRPLHLGLFDHRHYSSGRAKKATWLLQLVFELIMVKAQLLVLMRDLRSETQVAATAVSTDMWSQDCRCCDYHSLFAEYFAKL
jgi:hypothetical protein